jgi:hypothetical protein
MNRDGGDAELLAGAQHPQCDLAAIGNEDFVEHGFPVNRRQRAANSLDATAR